MDTPHSLCRWSIFWFTVAIKHKDMWFSSKLQFLLCAGFEVVCPSYLGSLYMRTSVISPFSETSFNYLTARGIKYLFPVQVKTFQPIYDGKDVIAQARTGTGKTLSFALPLIEKLQSVSQDGRRGRAPKVTHTSHLRVCTKTLERGRFWKWFYCCCGVFWWELCPFLVFVIVNALLRSEDGMWQFSSSQ